MTKKYAAILLRSRINVDRNIMDTLNSLNLLNKHVCVLVAEANEGMLRSAKDFITYGEIDAETEKLLLEKRGVKTADGKLKGFFRLHPPVGGYERKGIKTSFANGGALGYRGDKINDLIKRML